MIFEVTHKYLYQGITLVIIHLVKKAGTYKKRYEEIFLPQHIQNQNFLKIVSATQYCSLIPSRIYNRLSNEISFVHVTVVGKKSFSNTQIDSIIFFVNPIWKIDQTTNALTTALCSHALE